LLGAVGVGRNQVVKALEIKVKQGQTRPDKVKQATFLKRAPGADENQKF
jgi:hypothetical protein